MKGPQSSWLRDGRLHLHHGPIDLILHAWGEAKAVQASYDQASHRFEYLLDELVAELPSLRAQNAALYGPVARQMANAVAPFRPAFITPMAAVAGAVADAVLGVMAIPGIQRAYVNNGGDIAVYLTPGTSLTSAIGTFAHRFSIHSKDPVRGIATSGWGGRSLSLGIADAVTVLARTSSMADAAATMIANAVNLPGHPSIRRVPACDVQAESDLGGRLVTIDVGPLSDHDVSTALDRGLAAAQTFRASGLIESAALFLNSDMRVLGPLHLLEAHDA